MPIKIRDHVAHVTLVILTMTKATWARWPSSRWTSKWLSPVHESSISHNLFWVSRQTSTHLSVTSSLAKVGQWPGRWKGTDGILSSPTHCQECLHVLAPTQKWGNLKLITNTEALKYATNQVLYVCMNNVCAFLNEMKNCRDGNCFKTRCRTWKSKEKQ